MMKAIQKKDEKSMEPVAVAGLTKRQIQVLKAIYTLLGERQRIYARIKDIIELIEEAENEKLSPGNISRILTSIRGFYQDEPDRIIRNFRAGSHNAFQLNGPFFVTRKDTARILAELCRAVKDTASVNRVEFIKRLSEMQSFRKNKINAEDIGNRLAWASSPEVGYVKEMGGDTIAPTPRSYNELGYFIAISLND
jgi:hypothetical protein